MKGREKREGLGERERAKTTKERGKERERESERKREGDRKRDRTRKKTSGGGREYPPWHQYQELQTPQ